jgi:hypothetical protein
MPKWAKAGVALIALAVLTAMMYPAFQRERGSHIDRDLSNVKMLAMALEMYVSDYDALPDPAHWCDRLEEYVKSPAVFRCTQAPDLRCAYALNIGAVGLTSHSDPEGARLVAIFESDGGWNAHGGQELLPATPRHRGGDNFGFADGRVRWVKRGDTGTPMDWHMPPPLHREKAPGSDPGAPPRLTRCGARLTN